MLPVLREALLAGATLGQLCGRLRQVWGEYRPRFSECPSPLSIKKTSLGAWRIDWRQRAVVLAWQLVQWGLTGPWCPGP